MTATSRSKVYVAVKPEFWVLDIPSITDTDHERFGVWCVASGSSTRSRSRLAQFYMSRDGGTTYHSIGISNSRVNHGKVLFTDADSTGTFNTSGAGLAEGRDGTAHLGVEWAHDYTPLAVTETELLNGENMLIVNDEVLQYKDVTQLIFGAYYHRGLLRGRRGTESRITSTAKGDKVFAVNTSAMTFVSLNHSDVGKTLYFKCVTDGMLLDDSNVVTMTFNGNGLKPFAPSNVTGTRNATGDITFNWNRRTRSQVRLMGVKRLPYGEDVDEYEVDILTSAQPYTVLRTITTSTTSATYLASEMTDDGLTVGSAINFRVHQMSNAVGRGHANDMRVLAGSTPNWKQQTEFI